MKARSWLACVAVAAAIPFAASAEDAFTVGAVDVFAGPSSDYPPIAQLPPNTEVTLAGCLSDWSWCDVIVGDNRGWVYGADLVVPYQGARYVVIQYGPRYHFCPVVSFSLITYWDRYYRSRPFYAERQVWVNKVHIASGHGGRAPAGHEAVVRQSAPPVAAQTQSTRAERTQSAQTRSRTEQAAHAPGTTTQPKEAQRPQVAQSPRNEQPREQRKATETPPSRTAQVAERPRQAPQPQRAEPQRAEPKPQAARPEPERHESGNAPPREEKKEGGAG